MEPGHNSANPSQLLAIVQRIERIQEDIDAANADKSEIYKEAKSNGFNVPALRAVIQERARKAKDPNKAAELESLVETYRAAIGAA